MIIREVTLRGAGVDFRLTNREAAGSLVESWLIDLKGFYGGVGVTDQGDARKLGHGNFPSPSLRSGRELTVSGVLVFTSESDRSLGDRFVSGLLWDGEFGELEVTTGELTLTAQVKLAGEIQHKYLGTRALEVQIPLTAPDPFLYAAPRRYQIFPAGAGEGLAYPLFSTKGTATSGNLAPIPASAVAASNGVLSTAEDGRQVLTVTREGNTFPGSFQLTGVNLTPGKTYTVKTRVQGGAAGTSYAIRTNIYGGSYASSKYFVTDSAGNIVVPAPVGSWDERTWLVTAPQGSATMGITWFPIHPNGSQVGTQSITVEIMESTPVLDWGAGTPVGGAFANNGNADAHPTYVVHGSWGAGFRITTGGTVLEYPAPVVPGHPVVIDHKTGSVTIAGVDQTYRLTHRDWVAVPPGEAIQPHITALAPSTGWCDITLSDTYI